MFVHVLTSMDGPYASHADIGIGSVLTTST